MATDPLVDRYIAGSAEFAKPILIHLRGLIHRGCPEIEESIKWSHPIFLYRKKIVFGMVAFKAHCGFGFWHPEMTKLLQQNGFKTDGASGSFGRITLLSDLPSGNDLLRYICEATRLVDEAPSKASFRKRATTPKPELAMCDEFASALERNQAAAKAFQEFSPSHRREYLEWISEAKRDETRAKRIATALEWLAEGKSRNWKYQSC